jgi:hypothetical protein
MAFALPATGLANLCFYVCKLHMASVHVAGMDGQQCRHAYQV